MCNGVGNTYMYLCSERSLHLHLCCCVPNTSVHQYLEEEACGRGVVSELENKGEEEAVEEEEQQGALCLPLEGGGLQGHTLR